MRTVLKTILLFVLTFTKSFSQEKYWIVFNDRDLNKENVISQKTVENRKLLGLPVYQESDFGPKTSEIEILQNLGIKKRQKSSWMNAISATLSKDQVRLTEQLPFVKYLKPFESSGHLTRTDSSNQILLTYPLVQINAVDFFNNGLVGDGVDIGVIDGGFYNLDNDVYTSHLFKNNRIAGVKDFFEPGRKDNFSNKRNSGELHGTHVISYIGGFNAEDKAIAGIALRANYYLARSETSGRESRIEEDNWIAALEWLDSTGVRLVNSSLGYALGFTDPNENYLPEQMDGKTSVIGLGAKMAVLEKGMIIVSSAGNEGDNKQWKGLVSTPGDVDEVISVGACSPEGLRMGYSSIGAEYTDFVKPDVCVFSANGTSLAAPVITGVVAGMLQQNPELTWREVKKILQEAGSNSHFPNNFIGYGWPDLSTVLHLMNNHTAPVKNFSKIEAKGYFEMESQTLVSIFHKKNNTIVISQESKEPAKNKIRITKPKNALFTTLISENQTIEITWMP